MGGGNAIIKPIEIDDIDQIRQPQRDIFDPMRMINITNFSKSEIYRNSDVYGGRAMNAVLIDCEQRQQQKVTKFS